MKEFDALGDLVLGTKLHCSCGEQHLYEITPDGRFLWGVHIVGGPNAVIHDISVNSHIVLSFNVGPGGTLAWRSTTRRDDIHIGD